MEYVSRYDHAALLVNRHYKLVTVLRALDRLLFALDDRLPWRRATREQFENVDAARRPHGPDGVVLGAEAIRLDASVTHAVLLVHGFNDTPQSMAPLAMALHAAGWTVLIPRLPGHGCDLQTMARQANAAEWTACVFDTYRALRVTHDVVAVCGLSMGAALSATLAAQYRDIPALVLLSPYIGMPRPLQAALIAAWVVQCIQPYRRGTGGERSIHDPSARAKSLGPGILTARMLTELRTVARRAQAVLPQLCMPTLYLQSRQDNRITMHAAERNFLTLGASAGAPMIRVQRWLSGCGHIITVDYCRTDVAREVLAWITTYAGTPAD